MPIFRLPRSTRPAIPADSTAESRYSSANLTCSKKMNACVGYFDSGMMPIEQVDAQKVLKFHYALADAGLANAKRLRRAAKIEMLRDRQGLDHRGQFNFRVHESPLKRWGRLTRRRAIAAARWKKKIAQNKMRASPMRRLSLDEGDAA